jgi:LPLT family lysophospholipid transporter-like MFS transporter
MLGLYSLLVRLELGVNVVIVMFGAFVALVMLLVIRRHRANQRVFDSVALIGQSKH